MAIPVSLESQCTLEMEIAPSVLPQSLAKDRYVGIMLYTDTGPSAGILLAKEGLGIVTQAEGGISTFEWVGGTEELMSTTFTLRVRLTAERVDLYRKTVGGGYEELASWFPYSASVAGDFVFLDVLGSETEPITFGFSSLRLGLLVDTNAPPIARISAPTDARTKEVVRLDGTGSLSPSGDPMTYSWAFSKPSASQAFMSGATKALLSLEGGSLVFEHNLYGPAGNLHTVSIVRPVVVAELLVTVVGKAITIQLGHDGGGTYTTITELVDALTNSLNEHYSMSMEDLVTISGSGDDYPAALAPTYLNGGVDSTQEAPFFVPDIPGFYSVTLIVSAGLEESDPTIHAVGVGESTLIYGAEPSLDIIRSQVAQPYFNMMSGREFIESAWRGIAHIAADELLQSVQHRLNIHLNRAPGVFRRKWMQFKMFDEIDPTEAVWALPSGPLKGSLTPVDDLDGDTTTSLASGIMNSSMVGMRLGVISPSYMATVGSISGTDIICDDAIVSMDEVDSGNYGYTEGSTKQFLSRFQHFSGGIDSGDRLYVNGLYRDVLLPLTNSLGLVQNISVPYPSAWKVMAYTATPHEWHVLAYVDLEDEYSVGDIVELDVSYSTGAETLRSASRARIFWIYEGRHYFSCRDVFDSLSAGQDAVVTADGDVLNFGVDLVDKYGVGPEWLVHNETKGGVLSLVSEITSDESTVSDGVVVLSGPLGVTTAPEDVFAFYPPVVGFLSLATVFCTGVHRTSRVELPENVFDVPVLRSSLILTDPCYVQNEDYVLSDGWVTFSTPFTLTNLPPRNTWAEHALLYNVDVADIYGPFVGLPDLRDHPNKKALTAISQALVNGAITGPVKSIMERSLGIVAGSPFAQKAGVVVQKAGEYIGLQDDMGKLKTYRTSTPDDIVVGGEALAQFTLLQNTTELLDYLDDPDESGLLYALGLVNMLDIRHAFIARFKSISVGAEDMVSTLLDKIKPTWQDALLVGAVEVVEEIDLEEWVEFHIKQLVADVPTSYEDPDSPVITGTSFQFDDPSHWSFGEEILVTVDSGNSDAVTFKTDIEAAGAHKGWVFINRTQIDYCWFTGVTGAVGACIFGHHNGTTPVDGDVGVLIPGYSAMYGFPFDALRPITILGGDLVSLRYDPAELVRLDVGVGWRVHNENTDCWGLVASVVGAVVTFTKNMEPVPLAIMAPNGAGDLCRLYPPSGFPRHQVNNIDYLGPMVHPDYRVSEEVGPVFNVVARMQAHAEFTDFDSVIPLNYPRHPYTELGPNPCLDQTPTDMGSGCVITGCFFEVGVVVSLNGTPCVTVRVDYTTLSVTYPGPLSGPQDVLVQNPSGSSCLWEKAFVL